MPLPKPTEAAGRTFLRDRAYAMLFDAIQSGDLVPGEVLRDDELMAWLGMSRTPIRHALIRLEESGLIEMSAGRQTVVAELRQDRTNRALFLSGIFNEYAVRRVGSVLAEIDMAELGRTRDAVHTAIAAEDGFRTARMISRFFDAVTDAVGNAVLDAQIDKIDAELARFLQPGASAAVVDVAVIATGVDAVYDALVAADGAACVRAIRELYATTHANFVDRFRDPEIA
jgi:DNA-binding GntR family transcriptional regulator